MASMKNPIVKIIQDSGCCSYLVGCRQTKKCVIVDPKVGQEGIYLDLIESFGLNLIATIDTHTHADHLSASSIFLKQEVALWMSNQTQCSRDYRALSPGETIEIGELAFKVLEVPGHTPDSIALFGHGLLLSGDSLFMGGLARADFHGSDPERLFNSVQEQLMSLPDDTLVFPGHEYNDYLFSTVGYERANNPALQHASGSAYAKSLDNIEGAGNSPGVTSNLACNLERDPELPESPPNVAACCAAPSAGGGEVTIAATTPEKCHDELASITANGHWIDVREPWEFEMGRIPGTRSVPLSELGFHLGSIRSGTPFTISCRSGVRSMSAARTLERLGVLSHPVNLTGGILAWQALFPVKGKKVS
ncbi:MAG: sulfur dioxygenase [Planctomycetota bacterium]|jgi:sulfur dioxygenase